jgi:hypothetical protein
MKNQPLLFGFILLIGFACQTKEPELPATPLSEQNLEFEIYDSLVMDYLGNVNLMDISPDGNTFLLIDQNTDSIFVTNLSGTILQQYKRTGEGPENITGNRTGIAKFFDDESFLIPSSRGIFQYSIDGSLLKSFIPDFTGLSQLVIPSNEAHFVKNNKVYMNLPGRYSDLEQNVLDFQEQSKRLEVLDIATDEFESVTHFPKTSKFSSTTKEYGSLESFSNITLKGDTLFLNFRSEPKIFGYSFSNLDSPVSVQTIPFPAFLERNPDKKVETGSFNLRDFFYGTINKIIAMDENVFLISYLGGLSDEVANEIIAEGGSDFDKIFKMAGEKNQGGLVLFDGKNISPIIRKPENLGNINKFVSKEEIWFSLNFSKAENDYSIIYKTRLVQK